MSLRQRTGPRTGPGRPEGTSHDENAADMAVRPSLVETQTDTKLGLFSVIGLLIALSQVFCEVFKQVSNYSLQYYNGGAYPVPQTAMVVLSEVVKLVATIVRAKGSLPSLAIPNLRSSLRFLLPSVIYAINNNIYFLGLTLVPPPIWLILCSFRTVVTASIYKFYLRRQVSGLQFVGVLLIVISIGVAKMPDIVQAYQGFSGASFSSGSNSTANDIGTEGVNALPIAAILLAVVASCNSVGAAVYTETLFKGGSNKGENFLHQQFWLYLYGGFVASAVHFISLPYYQLNDLALDLKDMTFQLKALFVVALLFGSLGGLVVASILKFLDNIVKEYTGSFANILTGVVCAILFPDKFAFTVHIVLSMGCLLTGIYLYETKKVAPKRV